MPRIALAAAFLLALAACNDNGPAACEAAGGQCRPGGAPPCGNIGPQDCNPDRNPAGAVCCLPCPSGTVLDDAGRACISDAGGQD
jgi:hypothetical protein